MKNYINRALGLTSRDGEYITDHNEVDVITFSASSFTNPYIIPDDIETSKVRENMNEHDFFE